MSRYAWAVGRKAEKLASEMMEELGFIVVPYGYEYILKQFKGKKKLLEGPAGKIVRSQPDFLIVDPENNYAYFIEIKYRSSGKISQKSVKPYPKNYILLVTPKGILIADWEYWNQHQDKNCFKLLSEIGPFKNKDKDKSIILKYVEKAKHVFY
jgi:hypothetical protein